MPISNATINRNKKAFLEKYPEFGAVGPTLHAIGIKSRKTFYNWCENDPAFKTVYEDELLPNRRDEVISLVYQAATGRLGTHIRTWTEKRTGREYSEEVPNELAATQLTAAFGFLKATDHIEKPDDAGRTVWCEKNQVEISGKDGAPLAPPVINVISDHGRQLTEAIISGEGTG